MEMLFKDLIDINSLREMALAHYSFSGVPIGIIDAKSGEIYVKSDWQRICTQFHRKHPVTEARCIESNTVISNRLAKGEVHEYKCKNGLWDIGVPILCEERHIATIFLGQFFYEDETPDKEFFEKQALQFGFEVDDYLKAVDEIPRLSHSKVDSILEYNKKLAVFLSGVVTNNKQLKEEHRQRIDNEEKLRKIHDNLEQQVTIRTDELKRAVEEQKKIFNAAAIPLCYVNQNGAILDFNTRFTEEFGYTKEDIPNLDHWWPRAYPDPQYRKWVVETWEAAVLKAKEQQTDIEPVQYQVSCKNGDVKSVIISGSTFDEHFLATFVDVTRLKIAEERFERFFNLLADVFCIADFDGHFRLINPATEKILGYTTQELMQKPFLDFVHPDDKEKTIEEFRKQLKENKVTTNFINRYVCKDGSVKWLEWTTHPIIDQGIIFAVGRDRTEHLKGEKELKKTLAELERSNTELEQFAYAASHDLQEPLRAVVGFLQLLESRYNDQLDDKGKHYIKRSVRAALRMQMLIEDLLILSKVNSKKLRFKPTDIGLVVNVALEQLQAIIQEKNVTIICADLPVATVDAYQFQSLFQNLIMNGIKYNTATKPQIDIGFKEQQNDYCFYVKDNGIGIAPEFYERIFLIFQRLHSSQEYSGTGIGLALCKKIIEKHGGTIRVESELGEGATFYFTLPKSREEK